MPSKRKETTPFFDDSLFWKYAESAPYAIIIFDEEQVHYINPALSRISGDSLQTLREWNPSDFRARVLEKHESGIARFFQDIFSGKIQESRFEFQFKHKSGEIRWLDATGNIIEVQGKQYAYLVLMDITTRKQGEASYQAVIDHSIQGYFIIQNNLIVFANPAGSEITGYSIEELLALPPEKVRDLVYSEDQQMAWGRLQDRLAGKPVPNRYKLRILRKDGVVRWVEFVGTVIEFEGAPALQASVIDITEKEEVEEALRESEAKYRSFMEKFQGIAYHAPVNKAPDFFHGAVESITGYTSQDFVSGRIKWHQIIHPDDWIQMQPQWVQMGSVPGTIGEREYRIIRRDGAIRWLHERHHSFVDEKTKELKVEGVIIDVTTGKLAEQELRESQERFKQFFEHNPVYCYMISLDGIILNVNNSALEALGYQKNELVGKALSTIYAPESHAKMKALQAHWKHKGQLRDEELTIITKGGERRTVLLSADAVRDEKGKVLHSVSVQLDITDLKQAEEALEERLKELACLYGISLLTDTPTLDVTELIGGVVDLLPPAWQYPEHTCARIIVDNKEAASPNFRETRWKQSADITIRGERVGVIEIYYLEERPDAYEGPFLKEERDLLNAIAERISTAIELKEAELALEEARARVEFFNDLMTHDLNNINQGIILTLELLLNHPALTGQLKEQVTTALEQVMRSVALIKRVKQFTHIENLTQPLSKQDAVPVLRAAIRSVAQAFPHKDLQVKAKLRRGRYWVEADAFLMDVFYNLLHNTMKYDPKETVVVEVEIKPAEEEGFLRIEIRDHGSGIPDKEKERIFARFSPKPAHRWAKGSGIGLTLVQRIIKRYGGKIWVEDRVPGDHTQGASFIILLSRWRNP